MGSLAGAFAFFSFRAASLLAPLLALAFFSLGSSAPSALALASRFLPASFFWADDGEGFCLLSGFSPSPFLPSASFFSLLAVCAAPPAARFSPSLGSGVPFFGLLGLSGVFL